MVTGLKILIQIHIKKIAYLAITKRTQKYCMHNTNTT